MSFRLLSILLGLAMLVPSAFSATIHVPADQPTIQAGVTAAADGDTVLVSPGIYQGPIVFPTHQLVIMSSAGPESTLVECLGAANQVFYSIDSDSGSVLQGFSLKNIAPAQYVVRVEGVNEGFYLKDCWFVESDVYDAVRSTDNVSLHVSRCVFDSPVTGNVIVSTGPNCSFINNTAVTGNRGLAIYGPTSTILNNIVIDLNLYAILNPHATTIVDYNDFWNNGSNNTPGPNGISTNPLLVNPGTGEYGLQETSPCIDAGHPDPQYNDPNGTRNDIGAILFPRYPQKIWVATDGNDTTANGTDTLPFATVQAAVNVAIADDTVWIESGTYTGQGNNRINLLGKRIIVSGASDPSQVTIDATGAPNYAFWLNSSEDSLTHIENLTIVGPAADLSAGVTFIQVHFDDGDIYASGSTDPVRISQCNFDNTDIYSEETPINIVSSGFFSCTIGGGDFEIRHCDFMGATFWSYPPGNTIDSCTITSSIYPIQGSWSVSNTTFSQCGGIVNWEDYSLLDFTGCLFADCDSTLFKFQGPMYCDITNSRFSRNNGDFGQLTGLSDDAAPRISISQCTIDSTSIEIYAPYALVEVNQSLVTSCDGTIRTIANNDSPHVIGLSFDQNTVVNHSDTMFEIGVSDQPDKAITRNVFSNCVMPNTIVNECYSATLDYSCNVFDPMPTTGFIDSLGCVTATHNIATDPRFCDVNAGDYSLQANSWCLPQNNPCSLQIGAFGEGCARLPRSIHVSPSGDDTTGDGTSLNPFATIRRGVDVSAHGDTVLLHPGTYQLVDGIPINPLGREIVLASTHGPASTQIRPLRGVSAVVIESGEDSLTKFIGLTIGDSASYQIGQGIAIYDASPVFIECNFRNLWRLGGGAGVFASNSSAEFEACLFESCWGGFGNKQSGAGGVLDVADGPSGAAAQLTGGSPKFRLCTFDSNFFVDILEGAGGAISYSGPGLLLDSCHFENNSSGADGLSGGAVFGNNVVATGCTFVSNEAAQDGGAFSGTGSFINCLFQGNESMAGGGGAVSGSGYFENCVFDSNSCGRNFTYTGGGAFLGSGTFVRCEFRNNTSNVGSQGGAVNGSGEFESCTFWRNAAVPDFSNGIDSAFGGAFYGSGSFTNCTFVENEAYRHSACYLVDTSSLVNSVVAFNIAEDLSGDAAHGFTSISCSDIYGNADGNWTGANSGFLDSSGNISMDPRHCESDAGNLSLAANSPCLPLNSSCGVLIGADSLGCDSIIRVIHVSLSGDDTLGDGSESAPFATIQRGINTSVGGDTVLVLPGIYSGAGNVNINFQGRSIVLMSPGGADSVIIDIEGSDSLGILFNSGEDSTAIVDGFTVANGTGHPGAIELNGASPTIRNCRVRNSGSRTLAATPAVRCINSAAIFDNCLFEDNIAGTCCEKRPDQTFDFNRGAALDIENGSNIKIINCVFRNNLSDFSGSGGAVAVTASNAQFTACLFQENRVVSDAGFTVGGALAAFSSSIEMISCDFTANEGWDAGGALAIESCAMVFLVDCHFNSNWSRSYGGAIFGDTTTIIGQNCIFTGNNASAEGGAIYGNGSFIDCVFSMNSCGDGGEYWPSKGGAFYGSGTLNNCTIVRNEADSGLAIYAIDTGVTLSNCILAYNSAITGIGEVIRGAAQLSCSNVFGHSGGNWVGSILGQDTISGNMELSPLFCDTDLADYSLFDVSPCTPENNSCSTLIGALGVACNGMPEASAVAVADEDQLHVLSHTPTFAWTYFSPVAFDQDSVEIAIGTDTTWQFAEMWNPAPFATSDTSMAYNGSPLVDGQTYYGRLRVHNSLVWSDWVSFSFRMNSVPGEPVPQSPINQAIAGALPDLVLTNAADPESDDLSYDFQVFEDTALVDSSTGIAESPDSTGWSVENPLTDNTLHWWRARSFDGFEYSDWSDSACFYVDADAQAPSVPVCIYPPAAPDSIVSEQRPVFTWSASMDPDPLDTVRYRLVTATDSAFAFQSTVDSLTDTTYTWPSDLEIAQKYWWKVQAFDKTGLNNTSEVRSFWVGVAGCCEGPTGNVTNDAENAVNLSDLTLLVNHLFVTFQPLPCEAEANTNGDSACALNLSDLTILVNHLFVTFEPVAECSDFSESACGVK